jgi:hypothetical protein
MMGLFRRLFGDISVKAKTDKGSIGEQLVAHFIDSNYSKFFTFPDPKTKSNAQVADVLIWKNRLVFLIEVKTRDSGTASIESWVTFKIEEAVQQITNNHNRIRANEIINLHNSYYQTTLDSAGIHRIVGLIVLVYDDKCNIFPSAAVPDIYKSLLPIHVISWNDLKKMISEIDTISDLDYYLTDRYHYLRNIDDIPLDCELNVIGYYKSHLNKFPSKSIDFLVSNYWKVYQSTMSDAIARRNGHNEYSGWIDKLESVFTTQRKLFDKIPLGLYIAWEFGSISRRERAYLGKKLDSVQEWFEKGNLTRKFAWFNPSTGNWLVFYYSKSIPALLQKELHRLVELKLIKEIHEASFHQGVFGFGIQVSTTNPPQLLGLSSVVIISASEVGNKYSKTDIEEARKLFGDKDSRHILKIDEFPE